MHADLRKWLVHWRLTKARAALYPTILHRRSDPEAHGRATARVHRWERRWIDLFRVKS